MGHKSFLPQEVVQWDVWIGGLPDDDLHGERCSKLLIQMSGCSILLSHNLWFRVIKKGMDFCGT